MNLRLLIALIIVTGTLSCDGTKRTTSTGPAEVPVTASEIRSITYKKSGVKSEQTVDLSGHLFTKGLVNNTQRMDPCYGCVISMRLNNDTLVHGNMVCDAAGRFTFKGQKGVYYLYIQNNGFNALEIHNLDLRDGGSVQMELVQAAGNATEKFMVSKTGDSYSWLRHPPGQ